MKLLCIFALSLLTVIVFSGRVFAENISSPNYVLIDPEILSTSGTTSSSNYDALVLSGNGIEYNQVSSSLYKIGSGQAYTFMANVPTIDCFETVSNSGNTNCTGLPAGNGMEGECGEGGCYDRAMLQINEEGNPTDALYLIEMTKDNWITTYVVDGTSHALKLATSKTIADYKTRVNWELSPWNSANIVGLTPGVQYTARAKALHGDFTESPAGPTEATTAAYPTATFDLDIGTQFTDENAVPYNLPIGVLQPDIEKFSTEYIKIDFSTNARNGLEAYVKDSNSGLESSSSTYVLTSSSEDLSLGGAGDGFGIQFVDRTQGASSAGYTVIGTTYNVAGSNVGAVNSSSSTRILCSLTSSVSTCSAGTPTWVLDGKGMFKLGTKASLIAPALTDYQDTLTFTLVGAW